ncbi:MAG: hypothetical protein ACI92I_000040 [Acidimicrobiales bacterium]|jgi:hypothetical protein
MKKQQGFIAITSVLVLSTLFLSLAVGATSRSLGASVRGIASQDHERAVSLAHACAAHALAQLSTELHYLGDETLTFDSGQCDIFLIAEEVDGTRTIRTQGDVNSYVYRVIVEVAEIYPEVVVSSYQSVVTF